MVDSPEDRLTETESQIVMVFTPHFGLIFMNRGVQGNTNQENTLFQRKMSCPGRDSTHDTLLTRQSTLPIEL